MLDLNPISVDIGHFVPGVYLLILEDKIVYVGQSNSVMSRLSQHWKSNKEFDTAKYYPVPIEDLDYVEGSLIDYFEPVLNKAPKPPLFARTDRGAELVRSVTGSSKTIGDALRRVNEFVNPPTNF